MIYRQCEERCWDKIRHREKNNQQLKEDQEKKKGILNMKRGKMMKTGNFWIITVLKVNTHLYILME